jgi:hypothetical protein
MKLPTSLFCRDYQDPSQRFVYVDGAPYDGGPDAVYPLRRAFKAPAVKMSAIAGIFCAAALALALPANQERQSALAIPPVMTIAAALIYRGASNDRRKASPGLKTVVIDKSGLNFPDGAATSEVDRWLYIEGRNSLIRAVGESALAITIAANLPATVQLDAVLMPLIYVASAQLPLIRGSRAAWSFYARHQIERGRWTVTKSPPPLRKEARSPIGALRFGAFAPSGMN